SCRPNWMHATGDPVAKPSPGSGPDSPANPAPRPRPGSSEMTTISARPPAGFGPDSATTQPRVPLRSSPAPVNPVTSQPAGSGHGSQVGTTAALSSARKPSGEGGRAGRSGWTAPCSAHCHALCQALGSLSSPWHRGQIGTFIMDTDLDSPPAATSSTQPGQTAGGTVCRPGWAGILASCQVS